MLLLAACCLVGLSFAEPDENGFEFTGYEGYLSVSASVPDGTTGVGHEETRNMAIAATRETWEVWTHPSTSEIIHKNQTSEPASFANLSAAVSMGTGSVSSDSSLDASGVGTAVFTMNTSGNSDVTVTISVQDLSGIHGSTSVTFAMPYEPPPEEPPMEETWSYSHSEGALRVSLSSSGGTTEVPEGASIPVQLVAEYDTWDVEVSNYSNTRTANHSTSAASGASLSWSLSGDGTYSGDSEVDWSGYGYASITMGTTDGSIQVDASYSGGSASATLSFSAPSSTPSYPIFAGTRTAYQFEETTTLFENLETGTEYVFSGQLMRREEEVWQNESGPDSYVPTGIGEWEPAHSESISLYVVGDGGLSTTSLTTGSNGEFSASLTMGVETSTVVVSPTTTSTPEQVFYFMLPSTPPPEEPYYLRSEGGWEISWNSGETIYAEPGSTVTLSGTVTSVSWDVWTDGITEWNENHNSMPANDVPYDFAVTEGTGSLSHSSVTTDSNGQFSLEATTPSDGSSMVVTMSYSGGAPLAYVNIHASTEETWTDVGQPYGLQNLSVWASAYQGPPSSGSTIYTQVMSTTYIQQVSNLGNYRAFQLSDDEPVSDAQVSFHLPVGASGTVTPVATTGNDGIASVDFVFGNDDATLTVHAAGQQQTLHLIMDWSGVEWTEHSSTVAKVELFGVPTPGALAPGQTTVITAQVTSEELVWSESNYGHVSEPTVVSSSPIEGAQVSWSTSSQIAGTIIVHPSNGITNEDGQVEGIFTMGQTPHTRVTASSSPLGTQVSDTVVITHQSGWVDEGLTEQLVVIITPLEAPTRSLQAKVEKHIRHQFKLNGQSQLFGFQVHSLGGVPVTWSVQSGSAQIQTPTGLTISESTSHLGTHGNHVTKVAALAGAILRAEASSIGQTVYTTYTIPAGVEDIDDDEDGLTNGQELLLDLNPWNDDTNGDGVPDALDDKDGDGWSNRDELALGSDAAFNQTDTAIHGYSTMNRLTSSSGGGRSFTYTYDPEGNINH